MPIHKHNRSLTEYAKELRTEMTKEESHLWYDFLSKHPVRFNRQKILGKYIADFYSAKAKLVIELDGSQHYEDKEYDAKRTEFLNGYGIKVIRFWNGEVNTNFEGVCKEINRQIDERIREQATI